MDFNIQKMEAFLRVAAILVLVMSALLIGFDSQTKYIAYMEKTVTYKTLKSLVVLMKVDCVVAAYNILQLILSIWYKRNMKKSNSFIAWAHFLIDQIPVYITYAAASAAVGESLLVVTGVEVFQWMKWCNKFTRFCYQIVAALLSSLLASLLMAFISTVSAFNLFRLYLPYRLLVLKPHPTHN